MSKPVQVLLSGLCDRGRIYVAGEVEAHPSPRLLELAGGALLDGAQVATLVEATVPAPEPEPAPAPEPAPEPVLKAKRRKP